MIELINIILAILATYRISRLIIGEAGPFDIFEKIRGFVMKKYDPNHWLYNGIGCPLCVSFWIAGLTAVYTAPTIHYWPLHWLGIAGAVTIIYRRIE